VKFKVRSSKFENHSRDFLMNVVKMAMSSIQNSCPLRILDKSWINDGEIGALFCVK